MATKTLRGRRAGVDHGRGDVSVVAGEAAHRGLVPEHGHARADRLVLRHGAVPPGPILRYVFHRQAGPMAIPEFVRGRRLLRQFPPRLGMARGNPETSFFCSHFL